MKFYHDFQNMPEGELPATRDSARSANPAWTQARKEAVPPPLAVAKKSGKRGRDEVHKAGDAKRERVAKAAKTGINKSDGAEVSLQTVRHADNVENIDDGQAKDNKGTGDGHNSEGDPISTDQEPPTVSDPLLGLQSVISALKGLGLYSEYQGVLDRIRIALSKMLQSKTRPLRTNLGLTYQSH